jgi:predicted metal-dependent hydrolase
MMPADAMKSATQHCVRLGGREVDYRVVRSRTARNLRVRVGPNGVEVVQPSSRNEEDVHAFLVTNERWVIDQLDRAERLRRLRPAARRRAGEILFRGETTRVRVVCTTSRSAGNAVRLIDGEIVVSQGTGSRTSAARSLESWLRREARREIGSRLRVTTARLSQHPERVYVMGQRTKWGNCSSRRNLSFNWRLILAPEYVLRYLVTHEAVHLAIPNHSAKFWLSVQSLCRDTEKARQWLCRHQARLQVDLASVLEAPGGQMRLFKSRLRPK